jgi:SanA protein
VCRGDTVKYKAFKNKRNILKNGIVILGLVCIFGFASIFTINGFVKFSTKADIILAEEANIPNVDCILVLGAGVWSGGRPSPMLEDRLLQGIQLYNMGVSDRLLMSGDHGREEYDEVNVMKKFAIERGINSEHIFMDHAGFSTYESLYRARDIFETKKIIIVSQQYHLYRALYVAKRLGLEGYGVASDPRIYAGQQYRELREILARVKDFFTVMIKPKPTFLGEVIPVSGDGDLTND